MQKNKDSNNNEHFYPPVVSVLGHVDHGKTSLLDAIRKTNHASREVGGITQKIGASLIQASHEGKTRAITFIDTPGHEAFSNMRQYGVSAADIALLIVSASDGVMPQTRESIKLLQAASTPFIVVFTKIDLPEANIEKVRQQVLRENVLLEGLGGNIPSIGVSAKSGTGIQDLLDLILLVYDLSSSSKDEKAPFLGVIIESKLDKRRGILATVIVKAGKLSSSDKLYQKDLELGKVRALVNPLGKQVKEVLPGEAAEIMGLKELLPTGSVLYTLPQQVSSAAAKPSQAVGTAAPLDLAVFFGKTGKKETLQIILKTEGKGELEAIKNALPSDCTIVYEGQGDIGVADVMMSKDFGAIILGFDVAISREAKNLAENEGVLYRTYTLIYELLDEVEEAIVAMKHQAQEQILGTASIIAAFGEGEERIMGIKITQGRMAKGDTVKLMRGTKEIVRGTLDSLKRGKQDVKEVAKGLECGARIAPPIDFQVGDMVLSYK